jgi:hypothetical protein
MKKEEIREKIHLEGTKNSLKEAFRNRRRVLSVLTVSLLTFLIFMLLVNPVYSYQMLSSSLTNLPVVLATMAADQTLHGYNGIAVTALLAFLVGTVTLTTAVSLKSNFDSTGSVSTTMGSLIGFASAGCASCGAGVIALIGVTGGAAVLPFNGLEVQVLSILILVGSMEYTGRQDAICEIKQ